jgi:3-(3-hydroxy-phenyl)propionate hydroxylase
LAAPGWVVVLEKELAHYPLPRAVHLDHEMMRLFQSAGVIDRVLGDMADTDGHLHVGARSGDPLHGHGGHGPPFGWSNDYFFYQPELEAHLREGFAAMANVICDRRQFTACAGGRLRHHLYADGAANPVRPLGHRL